MKYIIVKESSIEELQKEVNEKLQRGYVCQGGGFVIQGRDDRGGYQWVSYSSSGQGTVHVTFAQALIKI